MDGRLQTGLQRAHHGRQLLRVGGVSAADLPEHAAPVSSAGDRPLPGRHPARGLHRAQVLQEDQVQVGQWIPVVSQNFAQFLSVFDLGVD